MDDAYDEAYLKKQTEAIKRCLVYHPDHEKPMGGDFCYGNLQDCYDAGWKAGLDWAAKLGEE